MSDMPPPPPDEPGATPPPPADHPSGRDYSNPQGMTGWATLGVGGTVELAGPGARLGARILDVLIMIVGVIVLAAIGIAGATGMDDSGTVATLLVTTLLASIIGILYEVTLIATRGQTLGKMATKIKVVRADNGMVPGWGKSFGRWIIPLVVSLVPFVGWLLSLLVYISLLWDKVRQGWHDKAAGTLVVKV